MTTVSPPPVPPLSPSHAHATHGAPKLPGLLDDPPVEPAAPPEIGSEAPPLPGGTARLAGFAREHRRLMGILAAVLLVGAGIGLYFALRPTPQPDFLDDDMDLVLDYALLSDDFNNLPLEQRLKLITDLVDRLKNMSSGDSVLMAQFAAALEAKARKQFMKNVSHLAIDIWDQYAAKYDGVAPDGRDDYLDDTFIGFTKMMESISGEQSNKSDEQRLDDVRKQAERDRKNIESGKFNPPAQALGRMFEFMNFDLGGNASPQQRSRGQLMMRDMVRHFRGEDVNGAPKGAAPAAPAAPPGGDRPADPGPK
jgi:hypothetical protein